MMAAAVVAGTVAYGSALAGVDPNPGPDPNPNPDPGPNPGDTTPPEVISTFPADGATNVDRDIKAIKAKFSEKMDKSSIVTNSDSIHVFGPGLAPGCPTCPAVGLSYKKKTGKRSISLRPGLEKLEPNTKYTAAVRDVVKDKAGNPLGEEYTWTFTTGAN
jgi:hypothetical protein